MELLRIDVYDAQGRKMEQVLDGFTTNGENQFALSVKNFTSGMYFYHLQIGSRSIGGKFVKN